MTTTAASGDARLNLYGMDREQLARLLDGYGVPGFHAGQVYRWLYGKHEHAPSRWTDLSRELRERLTTDARSEPGTVAGRTTAADGTVKYRISPPGGQAVEAVFMTQDRRVTLCLSSQVGCALRCAFCLTGTMGLTRNLSVGEIVGQVDLIAREQELGGRPFNVVFMGMGEPMHNYDAVMGAVRVLTDADGFGLSRRRITVSTVGLVDGIERLSREPVRPRLAVSLNATTDASRETLMPVNRKYPIARLVEALRAYAEKTGEGFSFEYVLLRGVNDSEADVARLSRLTRGLPVKLNLIPFNAVPGHLDYEPPSRSRVTEIRNRLLALGVRASIRWSRGAEARAACGQLALLDPGTGAAGGPGRGAEVRP